MKKRGLAMAGLLLVGYSMFALDHAERPIFHNFTSPRIFEQRHHGGGAPAPLLAAGLPAFAALGGGAAITTLVRRLRDRKTRRPE